jgi:hypothetical protein
MRLDRSVVRRDHNENEKENFGPTVRLYLAAEVAGRQGFVHIPDEPKASVKPRRVGM